MTDGSDYLIKDFPMTSDIDSDCSDSPNMEMSMSADQKVIWINFSSQIFYVN